MVISLPTCLSVNTSNIDDIDTVSANKFLVEGSKTHLEQGPNGRKDYNRK